MRRVPLAWVPAAAVLGLVTLAVPAPTGAQTAQIICPLASTRAALPCCGPPLATAGPVATPCCQTPGLIACPAPLTIASTPDPSTAGRRVTISGRQLGASAGTSVELWEKLPRSAVFKPVAQALMGTAGQYQFVRSGIQTNRQWYVTAGAARSATIQERVHAIVALTRSLGVRVSPNHAGERVLIQKHTGQGWKVIARLRLGRNSSTGAPPAGALGRQTITVRAAFLGDARNVLSVSRARTITP